MGAAEDAAGFQSCSSHPFSSSVNPFARPPIRLGNMFCSEARQSHTPRVYVAIPTVNKSPYWDMLELSSTHASKSIPLNANASPEIFYLIFTSRVARPRTRNPHWYFTVRVKPVPPGVPSLLKCKSRNAHRDALQRVGAEAKLVPLAFPSLSHSPYYTTNAKLARKVRRLAAHPSSRRACAMSVQLQC